MNQTTKKTLFYLAIGLTSGISMGIALGVATGNMLLWVLVGVLFSEMVGWVLGSSEINNSVHGYNFEAPRLEK